MMLSSSSPDADDSSEAAPDGGAGVQHEGGAVEAVIEVRPHGHHQRPLVAVHVLNTRLRRFFFFNFGIGFHNHGEGPYEGPSP